MIKIDLDKHEVQWEEGGQVRTFPFETPEAFRMISEAWLQCGFDNKYVYSFTWMGRPIIQFPEDLIRVQEIIFQVRPDVIIETGVAHGGSLVFFATLLKALGRGRVIGVDTEFRPHNRKAIEEHFLFNLITLIEGNSVEPTVVQKVKSLLKPDEKVLVLLDSNHSKGHVLAELRAYSPLVSLNSFLIAEDGIMEQVAGSPKSKSEWTWNNPKAAVEAFLLEQKEFVQEEPKFLFNEGNIIQRVTYWPKAFLRRVKPAPH